jgi:DNA-binding winged helix-turn-helix (wHTH) protein
MVIKRIFWNYFESGNFHEAKNSLHLILKSNVTQQDSQEAVFYTEILDNLESALFATHDDTPSKLKAYSKPDVVLHLNANNRLLFAIFQLDLNFKNLFGLDANTVIETYSNANLSTNYFYRLQFSCLFGFHLLWAGQLKLARIEFQNSLILARQYDYHFWEARNLVGLSLLDLYFQDESQAQNRLQDALKSFKKIDRTPDQDFAILIQAMIFLKQGKKNSYLKTLESIPSDSPYKQIFRSKNLFLDRLVNLVGIQKIRLQTQEGKLPSLHYLTTATDYKNMNIIFDEIQNTIQVDKLKYEISQKPLLSSLLRYFLGQHGHWISKRDLCTYVWREEYHPLMHDSRIYTSIMRLNDWIRIEGLTNLIVGANGRYRLHDLCKFAIISKDSSSGFLSDRKHWIVEYLNAEQSLSRRTVQRLLRISAALAKREIKELVDLHLIEPIGKGKKTLYRKARPFNQTA